MLLAIDTSTNNASIAIFDNNMLLASHIWHVGQEHSVQIYDAIKSLMENSHVSIESIDAIAIAIGPGSFNGLRVGVTLAKTFSFVRNIPLKGVTTLAAIAQIHSDVHPTILSVLEAGRGEIYAGWYQKKGNEAIIDELEPIRIIHLEDIQTMNGFTSSSGQICVAGELTNDHQESLSQILGSRALFTSSLVPSERAVGVGQIALAQLAMGINDSHLTLEPVYIRRPNITMSTRHSIVGI
jgi:tRNA threonylcarbamoyladenosine biosynthesis protein TsaB